MKFSQQQKLILALLATILVVVLVVGSVVAYYLIQQPSISVETLPTTAFVPPTLTETPNLTLTFQPTETQIPTNTHSISPSATLIVYPSLTPIAVPSLTPITPVVRIPANTSIPNPSPAQSNCSAQLEYAKAVHQYNLSYIDAVYAPSLAFYQNLLEQAIRDRDALRVSQIQKQIEALQAQYDADVNAENKRYQAEIARINVQCQ